MGFASRTLTTTERNYSHLDKEALAIIFGVKKYHQYIYGRQFEIKTDHKPLTHIFSEEKGVPTMASGRIQRWALILGGYNYSIRYKPGKANANADALSRLPLPAKEYDVPKPAELVQLLEHLSTTPVSSSQVKTLTDTDPVLAKVRCWVEEGWPEQNPASDADQELSSYFRRRWELGVEGGCVLWGCRVVVPVKGRQRAMEMLHEAHPGVARMKSLARSYLWWPGMDKQIEICVRECSTCQVSRKEPPVVPLQPWPWPDKPWTRIHIDYAGPMEGRMFLIVTDAHSKWVEIHTTTSSTSNVTIEMLRKFFATLEVVVSDNATAFTSSEFAEFLKRNGIRHIRTPPYHPASNGLVERMVQTFKEGMKRLKQGSLNTRLARFLFKYRLTPHSSTGVSPAELMFGRKLRSQFDLIKPSIARTVRRAQEQQQKSHDVRAKPRSFSLGERVYAKNYGPGPKWLPGVVRRREGSMLFEVHLDDGRIIRRHADQLRPCHGTGVQQPPPPEENVVDPESQDRRSGNEDDEVENETQEQEETGDPEPEQSDPVHTDTQLALPRPDTPESQEQAPTDQDSGETSPREATQPEGNPAVTVKLRRSARVSHPPNCFDDQAY